MFRPSGQSAKLVISFGKAMPPRLTATTTRDNTRASLRSQPFTDFLFLYLNSCMFFVFAFVKTDMALTLQLKGFSFSCHLKNNGAKVKEIVSQCRRSFHARRQNAASSRLARLFPPLMMSGRTFSGFSRQNIATSSKNQLTTSKMSH